MKSKHLEFNYSIPSEEHCVRCDKRHFSAKHGQICGLTNSKRKILGKCHDFEKREDYAAITSYTTANTNAPKNQIKHAYGAFLNWSIPGLLLMIFGIFLWIKGIEFHVVSGLSIWLLLTGFVLIPIGIGQFVKIKQNHKEAKKKQKVHDYLTNLYS